MNSFYRNLTSVSGDKNGERNVCPEKSELVEVKELLVLFDCNENRRVEENL